MIDAKRKAIIFLTLAFILAVVAAGLILNEVRSIEASIGETIKVATAVKPIGSYSTVDSNEVKWVEIPKTGEVSSYILEKDKQIFDDSIVLVNVDKGALITKDIVRAKVDIPVDHRIVWINPTENVLIDQKLAEGDMVDIIVVTEDANKNIVTRRAFANVQVVQVEKMEEGLPAVKVSLSVMNAEQLINFQNTAKQIRVLRVNQINQ